MFLLHVLSLFSTSAATLRQGSNVTLDQLNSTAESSGHFRDAAHTVLRHVAIYYYIENKVNIGFNCISIAMDSFPHLNYEMTWNTAAFVANKCMEIYSVFFLFVF